MCRLGSRKPVAELHGRDPDVDHRTEGLVVLRRVRHRRGVTLADTLVHVSWLAVHLTGHLAELDINPLMVLPAGHGVKAVDALAVSPST